ncbi:uncharacterized protein [Periplaneta americana]|uniref:uncharacterized protein isoform X2 n=1 Tax=Periplaneta americana TaxID=6978 RepID=UPI0037E8CCC9
MLQLIKISYAILVIVGEMVIFHMLPVFFLICQAVQHSTMSCTCLQACCYCRHFLKLSSDVGKTISLFVTSHDDLDMRLLLIYCLLDC